MGWRSGFWRKLWKFAELAFGENFGNLQSYTHLLLAATKKFSPATVLVI